MKIFNKSLVIVTVFSFVASLIIPITIHAAGPAAVNLGSASSFVVLSKSGISTTGPTVVTGDIGASPVAATYITGFGLTMDSSNQFSNSSLVIGKVYASDYTAPAPTKITTAINDMETAYVDAAGRTNPTSTELGAGNIGGMTLVPGIYKWSTNVTIPTDITLSGGSNDVWIFQIAQNLTVSSGVRINLSGGAQAANIFWQVAGQATLETTSVFNGNILGQTAIVLNTGAILNGRAFAQTAVTLDSSSVTIPSGAVYTPAPVQVQSLPSNSYYSASPTSVVAQNNMPTIVTVSPGVTMTTSYTGCSGANQYNTSTGQPCNNYTKNQASGSSVSTYNFGNATLKNGSRGESVMELQRFLNKVLNLGLTVDGKLGPKTISVIKQWQKDNGLVGDGLVGAKTKIKMNASVK